MRNIITIVSSAALLANCIFAAPSIELKSHARPKSKVEKRIEYEANWAGAVLRSPPANQKFNTVTGSFTVRKPEPIGSGDGIWTYGAWVGLDGSTDGNVILQGGIDAFVQQQAANGALTYQYIIWTEWYPAHPVIQSGFEAAADDVVTVTAHANNATTGVVTFVNHSTGTSKTYTVDAPSPSDTLPQLQAEWIVEDTGQDEFGNFAPITFTDCFATTDTGANVGPEDAVVLGIYRDEEYLASGSVNGGSVTVTHT